MPPELGKGGGGTTQIGGGGAYAGVLYLVFVIFQILPRLKWGISDAAVVSHSTQLRTDWRCRKRMIVAPKPPSQASGISAGISISCPNSTPGLNSISSWNSVSGTTFTQPSRARHLLTMVEASHVIGRVVTGVGSVSRGAGTKSNSPDRSMRPTLRFGSEFISVTAIYKRLLTNLGKFGRTHTTLRI